MKLFYSLVDDKAFLKCSVYRSGGHIPNNTLKNGFNTHSFFGLCSNLAHQQKIECTRSFNPIFKT